MSTTDAENTYWLDLFTYETWQEFLQAGGRVAGFNANRIKTVQSMRPGDMLLCYLTGVSRWIGLLRVIGPAPDDQSRIWSRADFPARIGVEVVVQLTPETAIPVLEMRDRLSIFQNLRSRNAWSVAFRRSPAKFSRDDGRIVVAALHNAAKNPIERPLDKTKLAKVPPILLRSGSIGAVTIPEPETENDESPSPSDPAPTDAAGQPTERREASAHSEIQWLLLKLGNDMGLDVWVARNDRNLSFEEQRFADLPKMRTALPVQFDDATRRTIELIDVLWLDGNAIKAAFEIESTTSIFSGLLRMSDLISMQPNINIDLYIVAPNERRNKVIQEINRPTFARLSSPMAEMCRYISFEELREQIKVANPILRYLKPEFVEGFAESCQIEEV